MRVRSLRRLVAPIALAATMTTVAASRAEAQSCVAASMADYIALAAPCELGGWLFWDFFLISSTGASGPTTATAPDLTGVDMFLTPFAHPGGTFGFDLQNFLVTATATGGDLGAGTASAIALFGFQAQNAAGVGNLGGAGARLFIGGETQSPALTDLYQDALTSVFAVPSGDECLNEFVENLGPGAAPSTPSGTCPAPLPDAVIGVYAIEADVSRSDSPLAEDGTSQAQIFSVTFQAVPEPAAVALLAGGLLALAGVSVRRRG